MAGDAYVPMSAPSDDIFDFDDARDLDDVDSYTPGSMSADTLLAAAPALRQHASYTEGPLSATPATLPPAAVLHAGPLAAAPTPHPSGLHPPPLGVLYHPGLFAPRSAQPPLPYMPPAPQIPPPQQRWQHDGIGQRRE